MRVADKDQFVELDKNTLSLEASNGAVTAEFASDKDSGYLALASSHTHIVLMKLRDQRKEWSHEISGNWFVRAFSGPGDGQKVEVLLLKDRVAIFAGARNVMYVEVFQRRDGLRLCRFSSRAYDLPVVVK